MKKFFSLFFALLASFGTAFSAITVRLDPQSCSSWSTVRLYYWGYEEDDALYGLKWPGIEVYKDSEGWYSYTFAEEVTMANIIWNNGNDQTVDIKDISSSTCYALKSTNGKEITVNVVNCPSGGTQNPDSISFTNRYIQIGDLHYVLIGSSQTASVDYQEFDASTNYEGITDLNIPSTIVYDNITYTVTQVGYCAFHRCKTLTSVIIPNSVTHIDIHAFASCPNLTTVTIGSGIKYIEGEAFDNNRNLSEVILEAVTPPTLRSDYSNYVFGYSVQAFYVPCGSLEAYKSAPYWSSEYKNKIKYKPSLYSITTKAEKGHVSSPQNLTVCDENVQVTAIPNCGCYFVRWADGNTDNPRTIELTQDTTMEAIFDYLLEGKCGKDSILTWKLDTTTMALEIIGKGALSENYTYGTFIKQLTIGNEITTIGQGAFYACNNLKHIILGSSVKVLEEYAFYNCTSIETITCYSQRPPTVNNYALYGLDYSTIVYVPADYLETYKMHDTWGLYDVRPLSNPIDPEVETGEYSIHYKDKNNEEIYQENVILHIPVAPQVEGFTFLYWQPVETNIANGFIIQAVYEAENPSATPDVVSNPSNNAQKLIRQGNVYILTDDHTYTITGQEVR